ncbi:MAG: AMP-binding protein [Burkholderiales bacterium]
MFPSAHVDTFARDHLPPPAQWPTFLLDRPEVRYPARLNAAVALLDAHVAAGRGDRIALRTDAAACTYAQLKAMVDRICRVLVEDLDLVPGNRVLLRAPNSPMMAACWLAVVKSGGVAVATMPLLRARELVPVIEKARVAVALCDARLKDELVAAQAQCPVLERVLYFDDGDGTVGGWRPGSLEARAATKPADFPGCDTAQDDVALIAFTSGTTGQPKGTMHFHRDVLAMCDLFPKSVLDVRADDVFCGTPPLAFTFGLGGMLCFPMRAGASTLLLERATPDSLLAAIARHRATVVFTAPTFYRQMAAHAKAHDLSALRASVSAGEALPDATRQLWKQATGLEMIDGIGSTELIHIFISSPPATVRRGAIGQVVPGYEARIVDDAMNPLPPGEPGRLAVRGPTGCRYLADDRQANYVKDGWNLTGDTFSMDADGYFFYHARSDDMIVSAGYNIAGPEVEAALLAHDAVAEAGVVGVPDDERGMIVKAFVVLKPGHVGDEAMVRTLQDHVKATIAPYKYPRALDFRDALPRTETGKLQRFRLKQG